MRMLSVGLWLGMSGAVAAQSSLGITGASVSLGYTQDEAGDWQIEAAAAVVDTAITSAHGLQTGLRYADTLSGGIGALEAHLYMDPTAGQKYGLFATLSDLDGRALRWGTLGAEGMVSIGPNTLIEGRAGIGYADDGMDFIFAGAAATHAVSDTITFGAAFDLADFDEPGLDATSYDASLTAAYSPQNAGWTVYGSVTSSGLAGTDEAAAATRLGLGISFDIGSVGGTDTATRTFRSADPTAPLLRRGLW